jgi:hypothetical protein
MMILNIIKNRRKKANGVKKKFNYYQEQYNNMGAIGSRLLSIYLNAILINAPKNGKG